MLASMKIFSVFALAGAIMWIPATIKVKAERKPTQPYIVKDVAGKNTCSENDPLGPCPGRMVTIENPLRKAVNVVLNCGADLDKPAVDVPAGTRLTVDIETNMPGGMSSCLIDSWTQK